MGSAVSVYTDEQKGNITRAVAARFDDRMDVMTDLALVDEFAQLNLDELADYTSNEAQKRGKFKSIGPAKLLTLSVLHRHGARGAGHSELAPFGWTPKSKKVARAKEKAEKLKERDEKIIEIAKEKGTMKEELMVSEDGEGGGEEKKGVAVEQKETVITAAEKEANTPKEVSVVAETAVAVVDASNEAKDSDDLPPVLEAQNPIVTEWEEADIENITYNGHIMLKSLGRWFSERYLILFTDEANERVNIYGAESPIQEPKLDRQIFAKNNVGRTVWRSSKSGRARESGEDFTTFITSAFNHIRQQHPVKDLIPMEPTRYEDVEGEHRLDDHGLDHYFRPWNVFKREVTALKTSIENNITWVTKAHENKDFLVHLFTTLRCNETLLNNVPKMLWCTTYVMCLYECERYWPSSVETDRGYRSALMDLIHGIQYDEVGNLIEPESEVGPDGEEVSPPAVVDTSVVDIKQVKSLALWVWSQRFVFNPHVIQLGGRLAFDMLQQALRYEDTGISVYSGHDYTMLGVLAALQLVPPQGFEQLMEFGAYITMELWSNKPPPHVTQLTEEQKMKANAFGEPAMDAPSAEDEEEQLEQLARELADHQEALKNDGKGTKTGDTDKRVLRILINPSPFDVEDEPVILDMLVENEYAKNNRVREKYLCSWPVREDREIVIAEWDMAQVQKIMDILWICCENKDMKLLEYGQSWKELL